MIKLIASHFPNINWEPKKNGMSWVYLGYDAFKNEYMIYAASCLPFGSDDENDAYIQWYMMHNGKSEPLYLYTYDTLNLPG